MNMLRPLRNEVLRLARHLEHLPRAREHLPRHEKWDQLLRHLPKIHIPAHQIIFMAAVGIAQRIRIVLENINLSRKPFLTQPLLRRRQAGLQQPLARLVVDHEVRNVVALGRGVFGMAAGVLIEPRAVDEKGVGGPAVGNQAFEDIAQHLLHREIDAPVRGEDQPIFIFEAEDSRFHRFASRTTKTIAPAYTRPASSSTARKNRENSGENLAGFSNRHTAKLPSGAVADEHGDFEPFERKFLVGHVLERADAER